jgi:hypothetical protein
MYRRASNFVERPERCRAGWVHGWCEEMPHEEGNEQRLEVLLEKV